MRCRFSKGFLFLVSIFFPVYLLLRLLVAPPLFSLHRPTDFVSFIQRPEASKQLSLLKRKKNTRETGKKWRQKLFVHSCHAIHTRHPIWSVFTYVHPSSYNIRFINSETRVRANTSEQIVLWLLHAMLGLTFNGSRWGGREDEWAKMGKKSDFWFFPSCQRPLSAFHSSLSSLNNWKCLEGELDGIRSNLNSFFSFFLLLLFCRKSVTRTTLTLSSQSCRTCLPDWDIFGPCPASTAKTIICWICSRKYPTFSLRKRCRSLIWKKFSGELISSRHWYLPQFVTNH